MKVSNVSLMNGCSPLRGNKTVLKFGNNDFAPVFPDDPYKPVEDTFSSTKRTGMFGQDIDDPTDPRNEDDVLSPFYKPRDTFQDPYADLTQQSLDEQQRLMEDAIITSTMLDGSNPFMPF